ncbi:transposable element Tcb1 transposase [Trichonephila clavipes]|nr:transposable element Tcb1 transposase [Trichonephila clavipes]
MHPDLETETQTEQIPDLEIRILHGTPGINHVHPPAPTSSLSEAKLNFNLVVNCLPMPHEKHQASFDQVFEFDRRRIVAYSNCGLSFGEIGQRALGNQATVMRICHCWMQEKTTNRRGRLHPLCCTTARDERRIVRLTVLYHVDTSRTDSVGYASFRGVHSYHLTPFASE